jgi:hypothetical protein
MFMKNIKNKIFIAIFALFIAFSPIAVPSTHAGSVGDVLGAVFSGGLTLAIQVTGMDASLQNIMSFGLTQFVLGGDLYTSAILCGTGIICSNNNDGSATAILISADGSKLSQESCGGYVIPLTFYIPSFNQGYRAEYCYDNSNTTTTANDEYPGTTTSRKKQSNEICTTDRSSLKTYRAPIKGQSAGEYGSTPATRDESGYRYNRDGSVTVTATGKKYYGDEVNCIIADSAGDYVKKASDGKCTELSTEYKMGSIDETKNKIAIYRFSAPISKFADNSNDKINNQALANWFIANPSGGYVGGGFIDKIGNGYAEGSSGMYESNYTGCRRGENRQEGEYKCTDNSTPFRVINYSDACSGNKCTIMDNDNVPQDSYIVYAAKILGDYNYGDYKQIGTANAPEYEFYADASTVKPNKFLSTKNLSNSDSGSYARANLAQLPYLYKDAYRLGNVYLGPIVTGMAENSCGLKITASPGGIVTGTSDKSEASGKGISCTSADGTTAAVCNYSFPYNTKVNLNAITSSPVAGSFSGWTNITGTGSSGPTVCDLSTTCNVIMDANKTINANFNASPGTCPPTDPCQAGVCAPNQCFNGSCAYTGTKTDCCTLNGCEASTCSDKTCDNGCNPNAQGTKNCSDSGLWKEVAP